MKYTEEELCEISRLADDILMKLYQMDRSGRLLYLFVKKLSAKSRLKGYGIDDKYTPFVVSKDEHKKINNDLSDKKTKVENEQYVLKTELNGEAIYLTENYKFDHDIHEALKAKNIITAQFIQSNLLQKYKCDLEIVPIKITYEW